MSRIRSGQPEKLSSSHLPARCQPYPDLRRLSQPYGRGLVRRWPGISAGTLSAEACNVPAYYGLDSGPGVDLCVAPRTLRQFAL